MVSVPELDTASPRKWRDAADDAVAAAKQCDGLASYARDEVAGTLRTCWVGDTGKAARSRFVRHADDYEAAAVALRALARVYDDLADDIADAQRDLHSALDYARRHDLKVDDSGRVQSTQSVMGPRGGGEHLEPVKHARDIISAALSKATRADIEAARTLRTIEGLTDIGDPKLVRDALKDDSPLGIALRLSGGLDGLHRINVPPTVLAAVDRAALETGMSRKLLLAVLWQEQQWHQNHSPSLRGPVTEFGRLFNWSLAVGPKPDKSLGITHIKLETAREVLEKNREVFKLTDGRYMSELTDAELAAEIEANPQLDVRLSAYHLKELKEDPYGSRSDKDLFVLYAADTPEVRELNETYGDESGRRGGDIKTRGENWDRIEPHLEDAMAWEALGDEERAQAVEQLKSQTPVPRDVYIEPIYSDGGPVGGVGEKDPDLGPLTPSPSPAPPPTPPAGG
ncbi:hypothetical protein [Streptomyces pini]|uniref:Uncharacterized protein n=1 Tax=Streptomyces pini TaxID=1520580 RepID=A0A1I4EKK6_9ACTN|nr:hypothetical protein [Streptomyces pini]SFL06254.1 hypothetical protein SAMN05192584_112114 [Streptomyces pini]